MRRTFFLALGILGSLTLGLSAVRAEGEEAPAEPPKLEKHPLADAKPGEYLRYVEGGPKWKKWYVHRVLDVREKDGKTEVFVEVMQLGEDGKELGVVAGTGGWITVPEFTPAEGQEYKKDEMVWREVKDKKVAARHLIIEERVNPDFPQPVRTREVWYTNDLPAHGKLKQVQTDPSGGVLTAEALEWGTMSADDLAKRKKAYEKPAGDAPADGTTPPPPTEKAPEDGGKKSCGGGEGCGGGK